MIFRPLLAGATLAERLVASFGAAIAISLTIMICTMPPLAMLDLPVIVAPLGASAVLVLAVPASPLAQPWPVIGGNVISTLVGITAFNAIPDTTIAAGVAVGAAILVMSLCRCLHPPGGATALTAVIGSQGIHAAGYAFAFTPVGLNSIALVAIALVVHRVTGRSYPHRPVAPPPATLPSRFASADLDAALADMHDSFDVARDDLDSLIAHAERHAMARSLISSPSGSSRP